MTGAKHDRRQSLLRGTKALRWVLAVVIALVVVVVSIPVAAALVLSLRPTMVGVLALAGLRIALDPHRCSVRKKK
ncbi:MAG: hypothetical protein H6729_00720 [Deltaproteobacteria bacterium]|nr:hypothetical protein [Deltaproteobacteria bacterium]